MKHIVSYSGGLGSYAAARRVIDEHGIYDTQLVFCDTKTEDEDLYRFLEDTEESLGVPITHLEDGRDIWQVFEDVKYMGNSRVDPCSRILKRELFKKWMQDNYQPDECILYVGIGWTESHRMKRIKKHWAPYEVQAPMLDKPYLENHDIVKLLGEVKPPRIYAKGFPHNNCGGFCVKTGQAQFKLLYENYPERYKYHEEKQEALFEKIGKKHGFIRMQVKGSMHYLSLKEFREHLEANKQIDIYDYGGCGCFV